MRRSTGPSRSTRCFVRFWIDWQQKQMQERLEELEYIKSNMNFGSTSSIPSNEVVENLPELLTNSALPTHPPEVSRRKRHSQSSEDNEAFNFDQRSEEDHDTANLLEVIPGNRSSPSPFTSPSRSILFRTSHTHSTIPTTPSQTSAERTSSDEYFSAVYLHEHR